MKQMTSYKVLIIIGVLLVMTMLVIGFIDWQKDRDEFQRLRAGLEQSRGTEQDRTDAVKWYRKRAMQGDPEAQYSLGLSYYHGQGVAQSYEEASVWYLRAARQGEAKAQYRLGMMYYNGQFVQQNGIEAWRWLYLASQARVADATKSLEMVERRLAPEEVAEARRLAAEFIPAGEAKGTAGPAAPAR